MNVKIGDYVTRNSYNNDIVFKVINIKDNMCYLKGVDIRLYADSEIDDLKLTEKPLEENYKDIRGKNVKENVMNDDYFYLPGKILHIDGDEEYLEKCLKFYKMENVYAIGKKIKEENIYEQLPDLLEKYKPDIVIITGHDAYYKKKGNINDLNNYKNTGYFIKSVKVARNYEKSHEKLVIIAGACQSNYEELIKAGANFASSPKRVNIHALDPAIIAVTLALTDRSTKIDVKKLLEQTKYGKEGMGGIMSNGLMYVGYPR